MSSPGTDKAVNNMQKKTKVQAYASPTSSKKLKLLSGK
jgi:hypothetical protein